MPPPEDGPDEMAQAGRRSSTAQIVAQQAAIAQIGQRALEERSLERLLSESCEQLARVLDAELTSVAELSADASPVDVPEREWRRMMIATTVSQIGWWGAVVIGFINSST